MKKFKSILCIALLLVVGCVAFVGCGPKKEEDNPPANQTTTITLAEAKTTIINALRIDEPQAQATAMTYVLAEEQENRDIFVKFGKSQFVLDAKTILDGTTYDMPAHLIADKTNGTWNSYNLESTVLSDDRLHNVKTYFNGTNYYSNIDNNVSFGTDLFGDFSQMYLTTIETMFSEDAFDIFYSGDVIKTTTNNGFTYTMPVNPLSYQRFIAKQQGYLEDFDEAYEQMSDEQKQQFENGTISVVIDFNSNSDITSVKMNMSVTTPNGQQVGNATITKYTGEITEPQWVTDYIASQN